jgi:type I restriction enzyme S subunit
MLQLSPVKLLDAFWFQEGPGVRNTQFRNEGIKLLNVANITKDGVIDLSKTDRHIDKQEAYGKYQHFLVDAGDLAIASSGISFDVDGLLRTRGAFVEKKHLPLCMNTSTIRFKAIEGKSDLLYLKHWLQSIEFRTQITRLVTGSAQKNFGPTHLKQIWINLPPLPEQHRIAAILDQADALRAKRREALAKLGEMAQAIFLEMFGDPASNPMSWSKVSLASVVATKHGIKAGPFGSALKKEEYTQTGYRVYGQEQVIAGRLDVGNYYISPEKFDRLRSCAVQEHDLLVSLVGSFGHTLIVGAKHEPGIINPRLLRIRCDRNLMLPTFLAAELGSDSIKRALEVASHGGTMGILNGQNLRDLKVIVPPIELQKKFVMVLQKLKALTNSVTISSDSLLLLFTSLQHRAFSGTL